ncbi:agmatine/peptidylarginine deiminase [Wenyingzhuangia heitensis]|uniref:Agmatine/peptidylarginine deiminase n=1 Tax=Wenyingzhuangia heitensis TaxID=1487859 RepID=A0ABX0U9F1_9FLAO|nr:agmatine deiminase family protein [Wenyingzhuangia heitensis]NIJ45383.1 agmatine/peptidylarginine deiminase [Wenyingzhuangia heitensis]
MLKNKRFPAEWEPQSFVQFTFPHPESDWAYMYNKVVICFINIIEATANFQPVLVGCFDTKIVQKHFYKKTTYPIHFAEIMSNDTWARDHAAITILEDDKPTLLDFTFNGWGQKFRADLDNKITQNLANSVFNKLTIQSLDFVLEGGAIESDGEGTLLTTSECLLSKFRNPNLDKNQIETFLKQTLGLKKILWLDHGYLAGDDTDSHIDTLARLCDPNTIAYVKCDDQNDQHFEALQKMETQLKTFTNANNQPYQLIALPWPDACFDSDGDRIPATYANFLIVNGGVLVPTYNVSQDKEALAIIQSIFPTRKVIGLDCKPLIDQHGSLHCISMQYPKQVKLNIS